MESLDKTRETLLKIEPNNISFIKKLLPILASEVDRKECSHAHIIFIDDAGKQHGS